jgi:hypothetical protein
VRETCEREKPISGAAILSALEPGLARRKLCGELERRTEKGPKPAEEEMFRSIFLGDGGISFLLGVLAKTGIRTWFFVVNLWWIAGENVVS